MQNNSSRKNSDNIYLNKNLPKNDVILKKPDWIKIRVSSRDKFNDTKNIINNLTTVCEEAMCPNIHECWQKKHAAFMILGDICTRSCAFCNVKTGKPGPIDKKEPLKIAEAIYSMQLSHVVITSVDRDDLEDGGASHFAECIIAIHEKNPKTTVEVLTPDFRNKKNALNIVVSAKPDVYNHNIETIPRLYQSIRPSARYFGSLNLLYNVKEIDSTIPTKSGIIVGMGETIPEVSQVMDDLRAARVDFITIGQYLQPTKNHWPVYKYVTPEEFDSYKTIAISKGFKMVSSSPMTRSSYHADKDFISLKEALKQEHYNQ